MNDIKDLYACRDELEGIIDDAERLRKSGKEIPVSEEQVKLWYEERNLVRDLIKEVTRLQK